MRLICGLAELGRNDLAFAGGKGAQLGELTRHGWPVPPGFVILTEAYRQFVAANGLESRIAEAVAQIQSDSDDLERVAGDLRQHFSTGVMPANLSNAILAAYRDLGEVAVAVRSSATALVQLAEMIIQKVSAPLHAALI